MSRAIRFAAIGLVLSLAAAFPALRAGEYAEVPDKLDAITDQEVLAELQKEIPYYDYLSNLGDKGVYFKKAMEKVHGSTPEFSPDILQAIELADQARIVTVQTSSQNYSAPQTYSSPQPYSSSQVYQQPQHPYYTTNERERSYMESRIHNLQGRLGLPF